MIIVIVISMIMIVTFIPITSFTTTADLGLYLQFVVGNTGCVLTFSPFLETVGAFDP